MRHEGSAVRALTIGASLVLSSRAAAQVPERFTNLQVLPKDTPRSELSRTMRGWATALGVRCTHCHQGGNPDTLEGVDFASDEKWEKRTARAMLRMVHAMQADYLQRLESRPLVAGTKPGTAVALQCMTCHRGLPRPETLDAALERVLRADGVEAAVRTYQELRAQYLGRGSYDFSERPVNTLAERLLDDKRGRDARRLLEVSAQFNPDAAWQQHLLGEARLAEGDRSGAVQAFERALSLNPHNDLTRKRVEELRPAAPASRRSAFVLPLEPNHSTVGFSIQAAGGLTRVTGKFKDVSGQIILNEDDLAGSAASITIKAASIDTGIDDRDAHLRQAEFFDAAAHPLITFKSSRIDRTAEDYRATGTLTLRGVAKEVVLPFRKTGLEWKEGRPLLGVAGEFAVRRSEYGVGAGWRHSIIESFLDDEVRVEFFVWTRLGTEMPKP
jgi:polyisoprenoid-binding protein YceI